MQIHEYDENGVVVRVYPPGLTGEDLKRNISKEPKAARDDLKYAPGSVAKENLINWNGDAIYCH